MKKIENTRICFAITAVVFLLLAVVNFFFGRPIIASVLNVVEIALHWILGAIFVIGVVIFTGCAIFDDDVVINISCKEKKDDKSEENDENENEDEEDEEESDEPKFITIDEYADAEDSGAETDEEVGETTAETSCEDSADATSDDNWI